MIQRLARRPFYRAVFHKLGHEDVTARDVVGQRVHERLDDKVDEADRDLRLVVDFAVHVGRLRESVELFQVALHRRACRPTIRKRAVQERAHSRVSNAGMRRLTKANADRNRTCKKNSSTTRSDHFLHSAHGRHGLEMSATCRIEFIISWRVSAVNGQHTESTQSPGEETVVA